MGDLNKKRKVRERLVDALRTELLGPSSPDEQIHEFPTSRYITGRLAPLETEIDDLENDSISSGSGEAAEDGNEDANAPLIIGFNPASIGISFLVDPEIKNLNVSISWGDYKRENESGTYFWQRYSKSGTVIGVDVTQVGQIPRIILSTRHHNPGDVLVENLDEPNVTLDGVIHKFGGYRAVSLFLVNRRTKGVLGDPSKDEQWLFQPKLEVMADGDTFAFVAKDSHPQRFQQTDDEDTAKNELLFRHAREFATGHGVAARWAPPSTNGLKTSKVFTEFIPEYELPIVIAPSEQTGGAILDMKLLADASSPEELVSMLEPMATAYTEWISSTEKASASKPIQDDPILREAAEQNLLKCRQCARRIQQGLHLLSSNHFAFTAFRFANKAMWDQRIHSIAASKYLGDENYRDGVNITDLPQNRTWRPFQIGFILMNLGGIFFDEGEDRRIVDLLWFPTGGGKTEAYLGLSAFTLGLRRLRGTRHERIGTAGVSIIMRYTLRLLTIQQFQRATALICACESLRRKSPETWGQEPFRIGVWVGRSTTPNTFIDSEKAVERLNNGQTPREGSPVQLIRCPRCGSELVGNKGIPISGVYLIDKLSRRTLVVCPNVDCEFHTYPGLPVVVVDDEVYRTCPSFLVATVDKFARLPFKGETRNLFGLRNRYSDSLGHLNAAHGEKPSGVKLRDAKAAAPLLPPDLIIQDELHLISGPLGTMVGLYETAVDYAASIFREDHAPIRPKIIASTATIRRAEQQAWQLYNRPLAIFPPAGVTSKDSFFSQEKAVDSSNDAAAGRLYVGVNAPGSSTKTLLVRVYAILLAKCFEEVKEHGKAADPYATIVGYFNSLRALGGAKRLVEDDINLVRLKYLASQRCLPRRWIYNIEELTSRIDSWKIPNLLKSLDNPFPAQKPNWPIDVLLATNMISVGVDIDRLGLMAVTGQPKTTAEYIQATSRVGRKHPGLVVTMYNWMGARDLSHYERFISYHSALYKHVEAISVTPFSSRALDRGIQGVFSGINRLTVDGLAREPDAENFNAGSRSTEKIIDEICDRAQRLVGEDNADIVRNRLTTLRDEWAHLSEDRLLYSWLDDLKIPTNNSRVLLRTAGTQNEGEWRTPGSLREVEPTAAFYLDEEEL
ncbi:MAG: DISARM system helicase DrmA [Deltaproteobacteria bacterium]|nr:DISARM system helicase DrmA [Deltaproteobacteria bacterium]